MEQDDLQELIDKCYEMAEQLLIEQKGEFSPFGFEVDQQGELINIGIDEEDGASESNRKIEELRNYFENQIEANNIRAYAITYDCVVKKSKDSQESELIAIECFLKEEMYRVTYYFPYKFQENGELKFEEPWGVEEE